MKALDGIHMGLGWYIHRSDNAEAVAAFFGRTVHLPLIRGYLNAFLLWGGEARVFEPKSDAAPELRWTDPATAPTVPVFRSSDLRRLKARLAAANTNIVDESSCPLGQQITILDDWGHLTAFREPLTGSQLPFDIAGAARHQAAQAHDAFNPGCAPMPADIQSLDWIVRRVSDVARLTTFYTEVIGFGLIGEFDGHTVLDMGDNTCLELIPGGTAGDAPSDRFEVPGAPIIRVSDFDAFAKRMAPHNVPIVNERIQFGRGALAYVADPDGQIIGYEERYDQAACKDGAVAFTEDLEANKRWREKLI